MRSPPTLRDLNLDEHLRDPARKQTYVNRVFAIVAGSYDRFTRFGSFGLDTLWKRDLVRLLKKHLRPGDRVVDLATGTGDLVFALAPLVPLGHVLGIDIVPAMIELAEQARRQHNAPNVEFRTGDLMATGLPSASVDAVTVSYGLRNCPDYRAGLAEIKRILKPGGYLASLDFVRVEDPIDRFIFERSLLLSCNFFGWMWHGEPAAYGYLARSIRFHATNREFTRALAETGFAVEEQRSRIAGAVYLHLARKARP